LTKKGVCERVALPPTGAGRGRNEEESIRGTKVLRGENRRKATILLGSINPREGENLWERYTARKTKDIRKTNVAKKAENLPTSKVQRRWIFMGGGRGSGGELLFYGATLFDRKVKVSMVQGLPRGKAYFSSSALPGKIFRKKTPAGVKGTLFHWKDLESLGDAISFLQEAFSWGSLSALFIFSGDLLTTGG